MKFINCNKKEYILLYILTISSIIIWFFCILFLYFYFNMPTKTNVEDIIAYPIVQEENILVEDDNTTIVISLENLNLYINDKLVEQQELENIINAKNNFKIEAQLLAIEEIEKTQQDEFLIFDEQYENNSLEVITEFANEVVTELDPYLGIDISDFYKIDYFISPDNNLTFEFTMPEYYQKITYAACKKYNVDYKLALGLFGVESSWNPEIGPVGSYVGVGMLNINYNYNYYNSLGIDIFSPEGGIEASVELLSRKIAAWGDINKALVAYNCGDSGAYTYYFSKGYTSSYYSRRVLSFSKALV